MAHTPKQMREHKKVLESRFLENAKDEMDELLMTPAERQELAKNIVDTAESLIKTPDKTQLTIAFQELEKKEIKTLREIIKEFHELVDDKSSTKKPPAASAKSSAPSHTGAR